MAKIKVHLYKYTGTTRNSVTSVDGLQTLFIEDGDGDGLISPRELELHFNVPAGRLLGQNNDGGNDLQFGFETGRTRTLYTFNSSLKVGDRVPDKGFSAKFPPFGQADGAPCFAADTLIDTARGPVAAGDLVAGDMVRTRDAGFQPVRWIGARHLSEAELAAAPHLQPIRIRAGALGAGTPTTDLVVSPQHRVLVRSAIAQKMFAAPEVLIAAKQLLQIKGIDIATDLDAVTYIHFLFDAHQIVFSNGAETESLHTGAEALKSVGPAARAEIFAIFPELRDSAGERHGARALPPGRQGRQLAMRHAKNAIPLVS